MTPDERQKIIAELEKQLGAKHDEGIEWMNADDVRALFSAMKFPELSEHVHEFGAWESYAWNANDGNWHQRRVCACGEYDFRNHSDAPVPVTKELARIKGDIEEAFSEYGDSELKREVLSILNGPPKSEEI